MHIIFGCGLQKLINMKTQSPSALFYKACRFQDQENPFLKELQKLENQPVKIVQENATVYGIVEKVKLCRECNRLVLGIEIKRGFCSITDSAIHVVKYNLQYNFSQNELKKKSKITQLTLEEWNSFCIKFQFINNIINRLK